MKFDEVDILDYTENKLSDNKRAEFEKQLRLDPELQTLVDAMQASVLPYKEAVESIKEQPMPDSIYDFFDSVSQSNEDEKDRKDEKIVSIDKNKTNNVIPLRNIAALLIVGIGGIFIGTQLTHHEHPELEELQAQQAQNQIQNQTQNFVSANTTASADISSPDLLQAMVIYQTLYSRETVAPLSQDMQAATDLLERYNTAHNANIQVPDMSASGFDFKRVQMLKHGDQPILQFVYLGETGEPVAVCITALKNIQSLTPMSKIADTNALSWASQEHAFMLIGKQSPKELAQIKSSLDNV